MRQRVRMPYARSMDTNLRKSQRGSRPVYFAVPFACWSELLPSLSDPCGQTSITPLPTGARLRQVSPVA